MSKFRMSAILCSATAPPRPPRPPLPPGLLSLMIASAPMRRGRRGGGGPSRGKRGATTGLSFLLALGLAVALLHGCSAATTLSSNEALVSLSFGAASRAFAPVSAAVASYSVTASGPDGRVLTASSTTASQTLRLVPGSWSIAVEGLASDGRRLVSGSISLELAPGDKQNATIVLLPEGGPGNIALSWSTLGSPGGTILLKGELRSATEVLPFEASGSSGSLAIQGISSGTWGLSLEMANEAGKLAGLADSVLVVAGCETAVTVVFEPPNGTVTLSLVSPSFVAKSLALVPPLRRAAVGKEVLFALPAGVGPGTWFSEGVQVGSDTGYLGLAARAEGSTRVDWVSTTAFTASSATGRLFASPPVAFGLFAWRETIHRADFPGAVSVKGLDGCRDLTFAPDGSALLLAGKDGNAIGDFSLAGGPSPLPWASLGPAEASVISAPLFVAAVPGSSSFLSLSTGSGALLPLSRSADLNLVPGSPMILSEFQTATALKLNSNGSGAYIASEGGNSIIRVDCALGLPLAARTVLRGGDPGFETLSRPTALSLSPDGSTLVVGSSGDDSLWFCAIDPASGALNLQACLTKAALSAVASLSDPVDLVFSPDGQSLFVLSYYGKSVIRLDRDAGGTWTVSAAAKSGTAPILGFDYPKRLALSPDGSILVVSGGGASDGLAAFGVGSLGQLQWLGSLLPDGTEGHPVKPGALAFSPDGASLAVACPDSDSLYLFTRSLP